MSMSSLSVKLGKQLLLLSVILAALCGCSRGGSSDSTPQIGANVPNGAGIVSIMTPGLWEIQNAEVIDTNSPRPAPPINGSVFEIDLGRIVSISGLPVDPASLSTLLAAPLEQYVNIVTDRTIFYGLIVDRRSEGESREEVALAGGSVDANTIMVEAFISFQAPGDPDATYTLSQYKLVRIPSSAPLMSTPEKGDHDVQSLLQDAFGRR